MKTKLFCVLFLVCSLKSFPQKEKVGALMAITSNALLIEYGINQHGFDYLMDGEWSVHDTRVSITGGMLFSSIMLIDGRFKWKTSAGIDPMMIVTKQGYNGLFRIYNYKYRLNYGMSLELFENIEYAAYGGVFLYQLHPNIFTGVEIKCIDNQDKQTLTGGINLEFRTSQWKRINAFWLCNYSVRPEISKFGVYSNFIGLDYSFF